MVYTENTPNPDAVKFLSDNKFSDIGAVEFKKQDIKKINNNHVKNLLSFDGIELILVSENFISVKKDNSLGWDKLKPTVISWINDYFEKNNKPILSKNLNEEKKEKTENENKDSVIQKINDVLDNKIRPAVARDGGDIKFVSFKDGTVNVELKGSCSGCPSSLMTLKNGVKNLLCHYVKEVKNVEAQ
tara:strand:- start:389 stop:949 length:561 start_codon:yes stop_codon:yes gene_type:complete